MKLRYNEENENTLMDISGNITDLSGNILDLSGNVYDPITNVLKLLGNLIADENGVFNIPVDIDREGVKSLNIIWQSSSDTATWSTIAVQKVQYRLTL